MSFPSSPPQPRRGGCAAKESCEATLARADGVLIKRMILFTSTTPAAATASAFPSSAEEGSFASVPQYFSLLQQMFHSRQRLLFAAKRLERFPLEIEKILFGRARWARHVAATDDPGEFSSQMGLMFRNMPGFLHEINPEP